MRPFWVLAAIGAVVLCGGCSLEIEPQPPGLLVATAPPGAFCLLGKQGQAITAVGPTPAIARGVEGGTGVVTIACTRPGFARTTVAVAPTGSPGWFGFSTPGYPERVDIALTPTLSGAPLLPPR
jgi:hypothetical protein